MIDSFWQRLWNDVVYTTGMAGFTLGFSFRYQGRQNVPQSGPLLIVSNHQSFLDPWLAGVAVKRRLVYLARKTLFNNPMLGFFIRSLNAVPIDQDGVGKEGLRTILEQLALGRGVLVFPEGTRTPEGDMHPLKPGIHLLIQRTQAQILPVGIAGAYDAWPIWRPYPIPAPLFLPPGKGTIAVSIGRPIAARCFAELPREQAMQALFDEIKKVQAQAEKLRRR